MKDLYAPATFPDVYFVIGRMNSAGTTGPSLLIGAEMFGKGPNAPVDELGQWRRDAIGSVTAIPCTVAHELIHYQQKTEGKTLLAAALREGSADFLAELTCGQAVDEPRTKYGLEDEGELWRQFSQEMHGTDTSKWMYGSGVNGRPADLAYFIGHQITAAYYEKASDKKKAIAEVLGFQDADHLLHASGYAERFQTP